MRAILLVSFGTGASDARKKTLDRIFAELREAWPEDRVYEAWTNERMIQKRKAGGHETVCTVSEALEAILQDGIRELVVQPTFVIDGVEHQKMKTMVHPYLSRFEKVLFGLPLLYDRKDREEVLRCVLRETADLDDFFSPKRAVIFVGHGSAGHEHGISEDESYEKAQGELDVYQELDARAKEWGYHQVFFGVLHGKPSLEEIQEHLRAMQLTEVLLVPFLLSAGGHAAEDIAGTCPGSWKSQLTEKGYFVQCMLKGLGEFPDIRRIYLRHVAEATEK